MNQNLYDVEGKFVFVNSDASKAFDVVQVDPASGLLFDYGVATYTFDGPCDGTWENYCTSTVNSSGKAGRIGLAGSLSVSANDTALQATDCPPKKMGLFIFGAAPSQLPLGDGLLCIDIFGSGIKRPWKAMLTDATGAATQVIDFPSLPGNAKILGGSTHYFQFWFRDPQVPGGSGSNLTDGAVATFCN